MGRKQRRSEFVGLSDEDLDRIARDRSLAAKDRRAAQEEQKYRRVRRKRGKGS